MRSSHLIFYDLFLLHSLLIFPPYLCDRFHSSILMQYISHHLVHLDLLSIRSIYLLYSYIHIWLHTLSLCNYHFVSLFRVYIVSYIYVYSCKIIGLTIIQKVLVVIFILKLCVCKIKNMKFSRIIIIFKQCHFLLYIIK